MTRRVLTDAQWEIIEPHCLGKRTDPGQTGRDPWLFVEAVLWIVPIVFVKDRCSRTSLFLRWAVSVRRRRPGGATGIVAMTPTGSETH